MKTREQNNTNSTAIDYEKLTGEDLFTYFIQDHLDKDYSSVVALLPYVVGGRDVAITLLERAVGEGRKFIAAYPEFETVDTSHMEYIGSIPDGALYLE